MKHLCLLIQDDPDWYDPRASLKGFNPAVTKDTIVLKSPHTHPAISNIEVVRKFGATNNRGEPGTLVIISHGAFEKTGLLSSRPVGGAIGFGGGRFLTRGTAGKLLGWTPYYNDILLVGCAVAATTAALPEDPVAFDGNGAAFCRAIANLLSVTVHASTTPMTMSMWKTPSRGDSVMEWASFLARAGNYVAFKAGE